jgi:PAS domain S-box-containing protein
MVNIASPYGVLFSSVHDLEAVMLPWGEQIRFISGALNPWRYLADAAWLLLIYLAVESCVRLYWRGDRYKSMLLGSTLLFFLGFAYLHGTLSDLGLVSPPPVISFTFMGLIVVMSLSLTGEVVKASVLSREVAANERRWRSLMENVHLLVLGVGADARINYVNPHFTRVSGFLQEEVMGKSLPHIFAEQEQEELHERFQAAMAGSIQPHTTRTLITKNGEHRLLRLSHVILRDANEQIIGTLSIGEDITDQKQAEAARDHAIGELETLKSKLEEENIFLREEIRSQHGFEEIVGKSNALLYVLSRVEQVADTDTSVLIQGETGVGKDLIARAIHQTGRRSDKVFITLNHAALPENLVESELFGHEVGAFTGANRLRKGRFEVADGGTIFLDEISELPMGTQAKLLRVLQEGFLNEWVDLKPFRPMSGSSPPPTAIWKQRWPLVGFGRISFTD